MKVQLNPTRERPARYQQHQYRPTGTTTHTAHERSRLPRRRPANSRVAITIAGSRMRALSRSTHSEGFHDTHFSHVERSKNNPIQVRRKSESLGFTIHTSRHRHLPRLRDYCGANDARRRARANVLCVRLAYHLTSPTGESERASLPVQKRKKGAY